MSNLKRWDNETYEFDVTKTSRAINPWLKNYGRDRFTYKPETPYTSTLYLSKTEGPLSHG
jgi:hypothetical protein